MGIEKKHYRLYQFARAAITVYHEPGDFNRILLPHCSGGQKSKIKMLSGLVLEAARENPFHVSFPASGGSLAIFGVPWLLKASLQSVPLSLYGILPACVSVSKFPFL